MRSKIMNDGIKINICNAAIAVAKMSNHRFKVGAAIVKGNKIISLGCNSHKTTPFIRNKISNTTAVDRLHAEMSCILRAKGDLSKCKIYIARIVAVKSGLAIAKPCSLCMAMIKEAGIKEIVYSTAYGWEKERVA